MSTQVDRLRDPEFIHKPILSRGHLEAIQEDPAKMEEVARLMGAVNLDNLFRHMQNPDISPTVRLEFQRVLNKMGRLEIDSKAAAPAGQQVVINITRAKDTAEKLVIEGASQLVPGDA